MAGEGILRILGGGVPPGSPNPDPTSDQKMSFSHRFSDLGYLPFAWEIRKFWMVNQTAGVIPFGEPQKTWAVI